MYTVLMVCPDVHVYVDHYVLFCHDPELIVTPRH